MGRKMIELEDIWIKMFPNDLKKAEKEKTRWKNRIRKRK